MEISSGLAALIGAFIGSSVSVITIYLQLRTQTKIEYIKLAHEVAKEDL